MVGSSARLENLADVVAATHPNVVILELEPGVELPLPLPQSPDDAPQPAFVVLSDEPLERWAPRALRAGARAVLPRSAPGEEIVAAVDAALAGLVAMPTELATAMARLRPHPRAAPAQPLTPRELEILTLLAEGHGNKAIAMRLGISDHTVKTHIAAVFAKLGVSTRAEAVATGVRQGFILL